MGLQLFRAVSKHAAWYARPRHGVPEVADYVNTIDRDGIVVVPDFFSADDFSAIENEYKRSRTLVPYCRDFDFATQVDERLFEEGFSAEQRAITKAWEESVVIYERPELFPVIRKHLPESDVILAIVSGALRRRIRLTPHTLIQIWQRADDSGSVEQNVNRTRPRGEYMLHADTHYPTLKAWLYLNDIDQSNGAFVYAPGSHRMTRHRLRYEYDASIRVARSKQDGSWNLVPYGHIRGMNADELSTVVQKPICGKANTLVIANTSGYHRRGEFTGNRPRATIHLNFRSTEGLVNRLPVPERAVRSLGFRPA